MLIITEINDYKILFNGSKTYLVVDNHGDCHGTYASKKRASNALTRILKTSTKEH